MKNKTMFKKLKTLQGTEKFYYYLISLTQLILN